MQLPVIGSIVDLRRSEREMGKGGGIVNNMELIRAMSSDVGSVVCFLSDDYDNRPSHEASKLFSLNVCRLPRDGLSMLSF